MILTVLYIIIGFSLLVFGGNSVVKGSSALAKRLNVPTLIIGLTIVAFGTSIPELFITTLSVTKGIGDFAVSDIIGSNIANSLLILGIAIAIRPINAGSKIIHRMFVSLSVFSLLFWLLSDKQLIFNKSVIELGKIEALFLIVTFSYFVYYLIKKARALKNEKELTMEYEEFETNKKSALFIIIGIILGIISLLLGAKLVVDNAILITRFYNLSETYIGLTILTLGTSLPELTTIIVASLKNEGEVILGNIIGSNIFNIALILGLSGLVGNLSAHNILRIDIIFMILVSFLLHLVADKKKLFKPLFGYGLIALYLSYFIFISVRG